MKVPMHIVSWVHRSYEFSFGPKELVAIGFNDSMILFESMLTIINCPCRKNIQELLS